MTEKINLGFVNENENIIDIKQDDLKPNETEGDHDGEVGLQRNLGLCSGISLIVGKDTAIMFFNLNIIECATEYLVQVQLWVLVSGLLLVSYLFTRSRLGST